MFNIRSGFQEDIFAVDYQLEGFQADPGPIETLPIGETELPSVPRANEHIATQLSFGERSTQVRTDYADSSKPASLVHHAYRRPVKDKLARLARRRQFRNSSDAHRQIHSRKISPQVVDGMQGCR